MITGFDRYAQLFRYMKVSSCDVFEHNSSYLWRHRSETWGINVYDKKGQENPGEDKTGLLRIEMQLRRARVIERVLGTVEPDELVNQFDGLAEEYSRFINSKLQLSHAEEKAKHTTFTPYSEILSYAQEQCNSRWRREALEEIGLVVLCNEIGMDTAVDLLAGNTHSASSTVRARRSRLSRKAKAAMFRYGLGQSERSHVEGLKPKEVAESIRQIVEGNG
jgi:hypothetical protein